jgi:hypothetical protein
MAIEYSTGYGDNPETAKFCGTCGTWLALAFMGDLFTENEVNKLMQMLRNYNIRLIWS